MTGWSFIDESMAAESELIPCICPSIAAVSSVTAASEVSLCDVGKPDDD